MNYEIATIQKKDRDLPHKKFGYLFSVTGMKYNKRF